jgi:hypothetical protein
MTDLRLTLTTSPDERLDASVTMVERVTGVGWQMISWGFPILLALLCGLGVAMLMGHSLVLAGGIALWTIGGGMIGMSVASQLHGRRVRTLYSESSLFSRPQLVSLTEEGVFFESRSLPWDAITAQSRFKSATLLHFSSTEALIIPDRDLPWGVPPQELQARVAEWLRK